MDGRLTSDTDSEEVRFTRVGFVLMSGNFYHFLITNVYVIVD